MAIQYGQIVQTYWSRPRPEFLSRTLSLADLLETLVAKPDADLLHPFIPPIGSQRIEQQHATPSYRELLTTGILITIRACGPYHMTDRRLLLGSERSTDRSSAQVDPVGWIRFSISKGFIYIQQLAPMLRRARRETETRDEAGRATRSDVRMLNGLNPSKAQSGGFTD